MSAKTSNHENWVGHRHPEIRCKELCSWVQTSLCEWILTTLNSSFGNQVTKDHR